ncbi:hypothetical protein J1614_005274 [Plenodomus biglobosus]|nr:hypothetical protein J1614_005274 [Plenodomus biglobosus]
MSSMTNPFGVEGLDLNRTHREDDHQAPARKRQKIASLNEESLRTLPETLDSDIENGDWSHLLKWKQSNGDEQDVDMERLDELEDEALRGDGESSEDEPSEAPDDEEDEALRTHQTQARCKLDQDEIVSIINESIEHYTNTWEPNAGIPKEDWIVYEPEKLWKDAENKAQRQTLVRNYEAEVAYYAIGLDMLCNEIMKFPGSNADAVRRQCKNLEMTVNNLELARWLLSIYALSPESDSDDDAHDAEHGDQHYHRNLVSRPTGVAQPDPNAAEIVDLGSPPASLTSETDGALTPDLAYPRLASEIAIEHERDRMETETTAVNPPDTPGARIAMTVEESMPILQGSTEFKPPNNHGDEPEQASLATVRRWDWKTLTDAQDRKRVVSKAIYGLHATHREDIRSRIQLVGRNKMRREMKAYIDMLTNEESRIHGVLPRDLLKIATFSRLFISWVYCDDYFLKEPSRQKSLSRDIGDGSSDFEVFFDFLSTIMKTTFGEEALQHPERPSQAEIIEISDDDDMPTVPKNAEHKAVSKAVSKAVVGS